MKTETPSLADVVALLESLRADVARLGERVATLEAARIAPAPAPAPIDEHTLRVIAATIAAYLGKKAHIRQIQLLGSDAWAQQGRVAIQASHALSTARSQP